VPDAENSAYGWMRSFKVIAPMTAMHAQANAPKRPLGTATCTVPYGGFTGKAAERFRRHNKRSATDRYPIAWTGGFDPDAPMAR